MKINSIATSSLVVLSLLLTAAGAYAQSAVQAHVPFAFKVGGAQVPAGTYTVKNDLDTNFIMVSNVKTGATVLALARRVSATKGAEKLIFQHYGSQYFLTEILGSRGSQALPAVKQEKELQIAHRPSSAGNNIEVALK